MIFNTWRADNGGGPQDEINLMDSVIPGWCAFLSACRKSHYVMVSRKEAISNSFAAMSLMAAVVQSQVTGLAVPGEK